MKHGDKEKGKASKASGKKSSKAGAPAKSSSKAAGSAESKKQAGTAKKAGRADVEAAKGTQRETGDNGKTRARPGSDSGGFTNPLVAAAFKRAVKKYPNTFRKLSD